MWLEIGLGHMGFTEDQFWSMSLKGWLAACRGYRDKIGGGSDNAGGAMSGKRLRELMAEHPDEPAESADAG